MGRKKKKASKPWCWYCNRDFEDEKILIHHQKAKHFKCYICTKKLYTGPGLSIHCMQVHKEKLDKIPNSLPNRHDITIDIYGMEGVPPEDLRKHDSETGLEEDDDEVKPPLPPSDMTLIPPPVMPQRMLGYAAPRMMNVCIPPVHPPPQPGMMMLRSPYMPPPIPAYHGNPSMMGVVGGYMQPHVPLVPPCPPLLMMQRPANNPVQQPVTQLIQQPPTTPLPPAIQPLLQPSTQPPMQQPITSAVISSDYPPIAPNIQTSQSVPMTNNDDNRTPEVTIEHQLRQPPLLEEPTIPSDLHSLEHTKPLLDLPAEFCDVNRKSTIKPLLEIPTECLIKPTRSTKTLLEIPTSDVSIPYSNIPLMKPLTMRDNNPSFNVETVTPISPNGGYPPPTMPSALLEKPSCTPPLMMLNEDLPIKWSDDRHHAPIQVAARAPLIREYSSRPVLNPRQTEHISQAGDAPPSTNLFPAYAGEPVNKASIRNTREDGITLMHDNINLSVEEMKASKPPYSDMVDMHRRALCLNQN